MVLPLLAAPVKSGAGSPTFAAERNGGTTQSTRATSIETMRMGNGFERFISAVLRGFVYCTARIAEAEFPLGTTDLPMGASIMKLSSKKRRTFDETRRDEITSTPFKWSIGWRRR